MAKKTCERCQKSRPEDRFFPSVSTADGLKQSCMACYFERNGGRTPKGFEYVTPPDAFKVWVTHGSLWHNQEVHITIAEAVPLPDKPDGIELLPPRWDEEGSRYYKPDWHASEEDALREAQRLVDDLVESRRLEFVEACDIRLQFCDGQRLKFTIR